MPIDFTDVLLCETMQIDYWTLMQQPAKHIELFRIYLDIKNKVQEEEMQKSKAQANKIKRRR